MLTIFLLDRYSYDPQSRFLSIVNSSNESCNYARPETEAGVFDKGGDYLHYLGSRIIPTRYC